MMKIILSLLLILLSVPAFAQGIYLPVASGTVTQANMKISAVDGTSFIDFTAANVLTGKTGNLLVVRDSSGRAIQGFIKAVGTAETEGAELATGTCTAGKLYKITVTEVNHFGTDKVVGNYFTSAGTETLDASNKVKEISTPSATGATIVSTKGGTAYNWATKNSAFNYNDSSGYTYQIYKVLDAPVVASGSITAGNALIDATTANAFAAPVGVDLSAYQTGKHLLALYDSSGYAAIGWISATAPSGEELTELLTGWNFTSGWTATSATIIDANTFTVQAVNGGRLQSSGVVLGVGALYKGAFSATITNGSVALCDSYVSATNGLFIPSTGADTYRSSISTAMLIYSYATTVGSTVDVSSMSLSRVTMPAATGALLLSTKGGSRGWMYKHASFNPNAAMTYKVLYVGD